jgi:sugar phosphate permease
VGAGDQGKGGADAPAGEGRGRAVAYAVTWVSYATYYLGRKGLPAAKATMEGALGKASLVGVETAYLASYAIGQYVNGFLGDRVGARRLIGAGMLASAAACFAFGASSAGALFIVAWLANGFAQSTGWPGNVKAMAEWTPPDKRGAVMGIWSTCYQVGGIVATNLAARFLRAGGWSWAFFGPAIFIAAVGVLVLLLLRPGPLALTHTASDAAPSKASPELVAARRRLLRSPLIWSYGVAYFCLKLIRYSLLFWLAYYFETVLHYEKVLANDVSTAFEWGGVAGAIVIGLLSDRVRSVPRSVIAAISVVGLAGAFRIYLAVGATSVLSNVLGLALIGFLLFGPDALLSGAAAQDAGGAEAASLAAGLINGIGSVGAVFQEAVTRGVSARYGWNGVFGVFVGLSLLAAVALVPTFRRARAT